VFIFADEPVCGASGGARAACARDSTRGPAGGVDYFPTREQATKTALAVIWGAAADMRWMRGEEEEEDSDEEEEEDEEWNGMRSEKG